MTTQRSPRALHALLIVWLVAVLALTLAPVANTPPLTLERFLCIACTETGVADLLNNWALFFPGGALAGAFFGWRRAGLAALLLTFGIEIVQIGVPGRYPALQDLIFNTLGAAFGITVQLRGIGVGELRFLAAAAATAWLLPIPLMLPLTTSGELYSIWTPAGSGTERYQGRLLEVSIDGVPLPPGRIGPQERVREAIKNRGELELRFEAADPPDGFRRILQLGTYDASMATTVGVIRRDLIFVRHNLTHALRFNQPDVRWRNAMANVSVADTVEVRISQAEGSGCIAVNEARACGLFPSLAAGWGHLQPLRGLPEAISGLIRTLWALVLGMMVGAPWRRHRSAFSAGLLLATLGLAASMASPDINASLTDALLLLTGSALGGHLSYRFGSTLGLDGPSR